MILAVMSLWIPLAWASSPGERIPVYLYPKSLELGQVALLRLPTREKLSVSVEGKGIPLFACPNKGAERCGFVPVGVEYAEKALPVKLTWERGGQTLEHQMEVKVKPTHFPELRLKVDPRKSHPNEEDQQRIEKEQAELNALFAQAETNPLWEGKFQLPVKSPITGKFGVRRLFNGEVKSVHRGIDLRANTKTLIRSANAGKVVLAKEMFFAGNLVVIDHGAGVFSSYSHLSSLKVQPGQTVKKGELLGNAGSTGRVTGPHLHWTVRVNGETIDPTQWQKVFNHMWTNDLAKR